MTTEALLTPRFKVIADYPGNRFNLGAIFTKDIDGTYVDEENNVTIESNLSGFPHLFQKLEWWQERDKKDMPKYLKDIIRPGMCNSIFVYKVNQHFTRNMTTIDCGIKQDVKYWVDENDFSHIYTHYEPATESEFNSQKQ